MKKSWMASVLVVSAMLAACGDEDVVEKPKEEIKKEVQKEVQKEGTVTLPLVVEEKTEDGVTPKEEGTKEEGGTPGLLEKESLLASYEKIQKELDDMPEKEDVDKGVTNAMKNYYGVGYEKYDALLTNTLLALESKVSEMEYKPIEEATALWKEAVRSDAEKQAALIDNGTMGEVLFYQTLYEETKEKCFELISKYF